MKIFLFSVKDTAAGFSQPFAAPNDGVARRMFANSVRAETPNVANTNPEDKSFWKLGELDTETGLITCDVIQLAEAVEFMPSEEELAKREQIRSDMLQKTISNLEAELSDSKRKNEELHKILLQMEAKKKKCKKSKKS